jgi:hypothetical protein
VRTKPFARYTLSTSLQATPQLTKTAYLDRYNPMRFLLPLLLIGILAFPPATAAESAPAPASVDMELVSDGYVLSPAYPNPFNPATRFSLTVSERQQITVEVFNVLGQRVRTLFAGQMDGGETRTFVFDASDLPSGIYLYRVSGRTFTETRNITLMK